MVCNTNLVNWTPNMLFTYVYLQRCRQYPFFYHKRKITWVGSLSLYFNIQPVIQIPFRIDLRLCCWIPELSSLWRTKPWKCLSPSNNVLSHEFPYSVSLPSFERKIWHFELILYWFGVLYPAFFLGPKFLMESMIRTGKLKHFLKFSLIWCQILFLTKL